MEQGIAGGRGLPVDWIQKNQTLWKKIGILAGVYLGMKYLVPLLVPFFIAGLLVCWCWPLLKWTKRRLRIRPPFVMAVFLLLFTALLAAGIFWLGKAAGNLAQWLVERLGHPGQAEKFLYECCDGIGELMHLDSEDVRVFVTEQLNVFRDHARQNILPGAFGGSWEILKNAGSWGAAILVTGVAVLLMASDFERIREMGKRWPLYEQTVSVIRGILRSVGGYLRAQCIIMGIVMVLCTAGMWLSGTVSNPIPAGIATGFLDALPVLGTGTVFLPWIIILVLQKRFFAALVLAVTYGVCVLARELLEPKLIGGRLGILPVVILASVYAGVKLYGFGGIILGPLSVLLVQELWRQVDAADAEKLSRVSEL